MTKATRFLTFTIPLVALYFLALLHIVPTPFSQEVADQILPVLPFWFLVSFGSYSLSSLGMGLLQFHDCPEAYESLLAEISRARDELRNSGVAVD